jgi:hypothetical protein
LFMLRYTVIKQINTIIMKFIFLPVLLAFAISVSAQKNVVAVTQSSVTSIPLPAGSKKDSRIMSTAGAEMLFALETNKIKATLSGTEVLILPALSAGGFNKDSLSFKLKAQGWKIVPVEGDEKFSWLYKDKRTVIAYLSNDAKATNLYFSNAVIPLSTEPKTTTASNTTPTTSTTITTPTTSTTISTPTTSTTITTPTTSTTITTPTTSTNPTTPVTSPTPPPSTASAASKPSTASASSAAFSFTSTNFDDGWTATVKDDWVQVVKGNITVLLHYPNPAAGTPSYDYNAVTSNAWNILVAGRYANLQNFSVFSGAVEYEPSYFGTGDVTDNATGKRLFVALFRKGGNTWAEIIAPDRNSFVQAFGIDINKPDYYTGSSMWDPLLKLTWYNRFAVSLTDIAGKWTNNFTGMQQYVNAYTGANAGMDTYSSSQIFEFDAGGNYKWEISVASGFVGSIRFQNAKSSGVASMPNNWQIRFSDLEGKPKTYNAYFSCIKGARILMLEDASYPTGYTGYGKM